MNKELAVEVLKKAVKVEVDEMVLFNELFMPILEKFVADTTNPYDEKLLEFLKPYLKQMVEGKA